MCSWICVSICIDVIGLCRVPFSIFHDFFYVHVYDVCMQKHLKVFTHVDICVCTCTCVYMSVQAWGCHGESSAIILYSISRCWVSLLNPGLPDVDEAAYILLTLSTHCGSRPAHWLASLPGKWVLESSIQDSNSFVLYIFSLKNNILINFAHRTLTYEL